MKSGRIWIIGLITIIIVLAVSVIPWCSRVEVTLPGVEVNSDGTVKNDVTVSIEGWYLKYLFRQDQMKVSIRIQEPGSDTDTSIELDGLVYDARVTEMWCASPYYDAKTDAFDSASLGFYDTMDAFILRRVSYDSFYVAASNVSENLSGVLERLSPILD